MLWTNQEALPDRLTFPEIPECGTVCKPKNKNHQEAVGRSPAHWFLACSPVIAGRALLMGGNLVANRGSQNLQDSRHSP